VTYLFRALILALAISGILLPLSSAMAVQPDEVLANAELEARARKLSANLRCLVCQNQSIDDSNAPLARDLRLLVRERLVAGDSDDQVLGFLVARYGEFVLLKPAWGPHTLILWLTPLMVLGTAIFLARGVIKAQSKTGISSDRLNAGTERLSTEDEARLSDILDLPGPEDCREGEGPT